MAEYDPEAYGWTPLPEPVKIRWTGRLRGRVQERQWDMGATKNDDGEWVPDPESRDEWAAPTYATLSRQKTNVVIRSVEEAEGLHWTLDHYASGGGREGITWMNTAMVKSANRIRGEIEDRLQAIDGVDVTVESEGLIRKMEVTVR